VRILVAPDKFKGSLDAGAVAASIGLGLRDAWPEAEIRLLPLADGGEGTASVICSAAGGEWVTSDAHDAFGTPIAARYGLIRSEGTAVMEMSEAAGLWRIPREQRDADLASSFGIGEMLLHAAQSGASKIIIGLGGSATNDGGVGMARALGVQFIDAAGKDLAGRISELARLAHIRAPEILGLPRLIAAADVRNPLLGPTGATRVFGAQKGATSEQTELLEAALTRLADIVKSDLGMDFRDATGAGAAGGLGFGLMSFCGAKIRSGFDVVAKAVGLEDAVRRADAVVTGEGRLDAQTLDGKAPAGVARLARRLGKKVYAIVGEVEDAAMVRDLFDAIFVVERGGQTRASAILNAADLLRETARTSAKHFCCRL